jgi:hypothetical protein
MSGTDNMTAGMRRKWRNEKQMWEEKRSGVFGIDGDVSLWQNLTAGRLDEPASRVYTIVEAH